MPRKNVRITLSQNELIKIRSRFKPALFLDRDGVIIKECNYIRDPSFLELEKGVLELFFSATRNCWPIIIITNQSGIEKGFFSWDDYHKVTNKMLHLIGSEFKPSAIYANSQKEFLNKDCWRKPSPNMIFQASKDLNIKLSDSIFIGDRLSDIKAAINSGIGNIYHVKTGHGHKERKDVIQYSIDLKENKNQNRVLLISSLFELKDDIFISKSR